MCGISGVLDLEGREVDPVGLEAMCQTLVHRGPDSAGSVIVGPAGLAMRRLAILDIDGGRQPLSNEDGSIHLIANGEIYNYRELRTLLTERGHRFRSATDCEVVVHAYEEYGDDFLTRLNGMFALALWDTRRQRLLLARDRAGIKPLYYSVHQGKLLFGSEPKALLAHPGFDRAVDLAAFDQYLTYLYVPTPGCMYRGVRKLRPGHLLVADASAGTIQEKAYWELDLRPDPELARAPQEELAERLWQTFREAVGMELMSDVPLGVFLSGGIDSSAVAAAMSELRPGSVRSFSIGFEDPRLDESRYARQVAAALGTQHSEVIFDPRRLGELVPEVMGFLDEPFADSSVLPTHLLSRFARKQVIVALGGDGGDELFAGYDPVMAHRLAAGYQLLPRVLRDGILAPLAERFPVSDDNTSLSYRGRRFIRHAGRPLGERYQAWMCCFRPEDKAALLTREVRAAVAPDGGALEEHLARCLGYDALAQVLYLDFKMYLEGDILVKVDRASMGCSLEVRVPFLNLKMLDLATRLPSALKLRGLTRKYLLRKALKGRIPDEILRRPKRGFGVPLADWLRSELKVLLLDMLNPSRLARQGLFEPAAVGRLIADHLGQRGDHSKILWTILAFQLWHARYLEGAAPTSEATAAGHAG